MDFKDLVQYLTLNNLTISTMESCTGGALANTLTNIAGASDVFKFGAVTYSNEFKIKMGVDKKVIEKYSVYSMETANQMSKIISTFTNSDYGVGITGKINKCDKSNNYGKDNEIFISIYDKKSNKWYNERVVVEDKDRQANKNLITHTVLLMFNQIIK